MSATKKAGNLPDPQTELPGGGNIDNIREIIFGTQMRHYEKRFQRLEESLAKESTDLREELRRRLDALEAYAKQETEALADRLKAEKDERKSACADLGKELTGLAKDTEKKTGRLEERATKSHSELRAVLLEQSKSLSSEIKDKGDGLLRELRRELEELRTEKTDRAALTALFTEMAMRLSDELRLPITDSD